jgi:hypothetical protein
MAGEAKLEKVSTALLDPRPGTLERCEADLHELIAQLQSESEQMSARSVDYACPEDRTAILRLRYRNRLLALQVQNSVNLFQGWVQLGLSQGYTERGTPELPPSDSFTSYEV